MDVIAFIQTLQISTQGSGGGSEEILWGDTVVLFGSTTVTFND